MVHAFYALMIAQPLLGFMQAATYVDFEIHAFGALNITALLPSNANMTAILNIIHGTCAWFLALLVIGVLGITAAVMKSGMLSPWAAALIAAAVTLVAFRINAQRRATLADHDHGAAERRWWRSDRTWAAVLCATAVWMHFFFA